MNGRERVRGALKGETIDRIPFYCEELFVNTQRQWIKKGLPHDQDALEDLFDYDGTKLFIDSSMRFEEKLIEENDETVTVADKSLSE